MVTLTTRYSDALKWVCEIHAQQRRRLHQDPYVGHLLRVGGMILEWATDEDEALAALLHDAAEDCGGYAMLEEIRCRFGEKVARLVEQCSDSLAVDADKKAPWRERKEAHIARTATAEREARLIMLCDKLDNMRSLLNQLELSDADMVFSQFRGGRATLWYFRAMIEALAPGLPEELVREARRDLTALENKT
ncbi:MAG: HD domain-containing protein [Planctomycetia bacterium]|nr:HD domain-containing protein [Planctomycetia bacterium]